MRIRPKSRERSRITAWRLMVYASKSFPHTHIYIYLHCRRLVQGFRMDFYYYYYCQTTTKNGFGRGGRDGSRKDGQQNELRPKPTPPPPPLRKVKRKKCVRGQVWRVLWLETREVDLADGSSFAGEKTKKIN